jgi:hypothetical protein
MRFAAFIIVLDIVVLGLSVSVNIFQEFFCKSHPARFLTCLGPLMGANLMCLPTVGADLFPLLLSVATLIILLLQCVAPVRCSPCNINTLTRFCIPLPSYHRIVFDLTSENAMTARPVFEIPLLGSFTIVWLGEDMQLVVPDPRIRVLIASDPHIHSLQFFLDVEICGSSELLDLL